MDNAINLKFMLLNAENLFLLWDEKPPVDFLNLNEKQWKDLSSSVFPNKPLRKLKEIASIFLEVDPDIIMLTEVGGEESLQNFNEHFLQNNFYTALIEGNSDRSIDVGFLINKRCGFHFHIETNKNRSINFLYPHEKESLAKGINTEHIPTSHKFSRDVAELHLFKTKKEEPFLITLLTHLKSPLDPDYIDPQGAERRQAELKTLVQIYNEQKNNYKDCPIIVCGDFNGNASRHNTDKEFKDLYQLTDLEDVLELNNTPIIERQTFFHVRSGGKSEGRQIDFCFLGDSVKKNFQNTKSFIYRYKNELGIRIHAPSTIEEKEYLPSDHYPIIFELHNLNLIKKN